MAITKFEYKINTMKHLLTIALLALAIACSKKKDDPAPVTPTVQPTTLSITVRNELGNTVANAGIKIYSTFEAYTADTLDDTPPVTSFPLAYTSFTNSSGVYTTTIDAGKWYWRVESDACHKPTTNTTVSPLSANVDNRVTVIMQPSATINLTSTSSNPYYIYLDDVLKFTMDGNTSKSLTCTLGSHSVRVLQKSGYVVFPTDNTYPTTLSTCGETKSITFP